MDLAGRKKIVSNLESGLRFGPDTDEHYTFYVNPDEYELRGGEGAHEDTPESRRYIDISSGAEPSKVLESLDNEGLLEVEGEKPNQDSSLPVLKLLGISRSGNSSLTTLSFEDVAEPR
ncbi:MAG TPA: hypothetical protein VFW77_00640 [Candidatus Saccharimonadales bacterium]|nr:hypothetical protein [Candidatus Saccharimonadales bacterium]